MVFASATKRGIVPSLSQFLHVSDPYWQPRACGIVAIKMVMDYFEIPSPPLDRLIKIGAGLSKAGEYDPKTGWEHSVLADIARGHGLRAEPHNLTRKDPIAAFRILKRIVRQVPCVTSIHKDFNPQNDGHLIVVRRIRGQYVFYNEPAARAESDVRRRIHVDRFLAGWRRRIIIVKR